MSSEGVGARKYWDPVEAVSVFVGGGIAIGGGAFGIDTDLGDSSDSGWGTGIWLDTGVVFKLDNVINLGVELKYSFLPVTIFDTDVNAGGVQFGLVMGYHW